MPVIDKIKNLVHHKQPAPDAPAAPAVEHVATTQEPIKSDVLLNQKAQLNHQTELNREANLATEQQLGTNQSSQLRQEEQLLQQQHQQHQQQQVYVQSDNRASVGLTRQEPTVMQVVEKDVVVHERIHPVVKEEVQPIIYREREQLDVKQVTQLLHETHVQPTLVEQRELPAEVREAVVERSAPLPENVILPTRQVDATATTHVVHAAIVNEVIKKTVIEEVQPVLQRDIIAPTLIQNVQPIHERVVEAPTVYRQTTEVRELGTTTVGYNSTTHLNSNLYNNQNTQQTTILAEQPLQGQRRLSQSGNSGVYANQNLSQSGNSGVYANQNLNQSGNSGVYNNQNVNVLPTGQVLPPVQSTRPDYAYLPQGYAEKRPDFVGSGSQFTAASGTLPVGALAHSKNILTQNALPFNAGTNATVAPQAYPRQ